MTKFNFDDSFSIRNKLTGNIFVNDVDRQKIFLKLQAKRMLIADFCITDMTWNTSNKDIDSITLNGTSGSTAYTLASNAAALKNRIFKEAVPNGKEQSMAGTLDKKFMNFAVNSYLYEFILLIVRAVQNDTLPVGLETVTLSISTADTESLKNAVVTITAKDEDNNAVQGLTISGKVGGTTVSGTSDSSGQVSVTLEATGTYAVEVASAATTAYKAASKTGSVEVTEIPAESEGEPSG